MGLFDKKFCDICGNKIGLLGNRKLEDGNSCKDCTKKLSPWFDERRHSTVAQIKEQLAYREDNRQAVAAFNTTRSFGESYQILYIDERTRKFLIAGSGSFKDNNPDVVDFSQVTSVNLDARDSRKELKQKDAQGNEISFNPPRYEHEYDFNVVIRVNHPWFDEMRFKLNRNKLVIQELGAVRKGFMITQTVFDPHMSYEYQNYEKTVKEITDLLQGRAGTVASVIQPCATVDDAIQAVDTPAAADGA